MLILHLPDNKFSIGVDGPIFLNALDFLQELSIGMRANLLLIIRPCCLVHISIEVFILRDGIRVIGFLMHIDAVEVHILDVFLFTSRELAFALALHAVMIVILIGSFHMLVAGDFFAGDSMQHGVIAECWSAVVVGVVELGVVGLFEFQ